MLRGRCDAALAKAQANVRKLAEAAAKEIQIRRLDYKKDSLQDIFLKAMESNLGSL